MYLKCVQNERPVCPDIYFWTIITFNFIIPLPLNLSDVFVFNCFNIYPMLWEVRYAMWYPCLWNMLHSECSRVLVLSMVTYFIFGGLNVFSFHSVCFLFAS